MGKNKHSSFFLILLLSTVIIFGCTTIPKESVDLSKEVGNGIAESRRTDINLLNAYFQTKKTAIDAWIENVYLPEFLKNVQARLKKAGLPETLTTNQMKDIMARVITKRDQMQADLEKTRILFVEQRNNYYASLSQANSGVTAILQSAVNVKEATSSLTASAKSVSKGKIDLDLINQEFAEYLKKAGSAAGETTSLYEKINALFQQKGN